MPDFADQLPQAAFLDLLMRGIPQFDIQEVLSKTRLGDFHMFVADSVKLSDTVDRDILVCALGRLELPAWFREVHFASHQEVRLRFKLAAGLGVAWTRDGGIPQDAPQCGVHRRTLCLVVPTSGKSKKASLSRYLFITLSALLLAAQYAVSCVKVVGQESFPSECVLLSTSPPKTRQGMPAWRDADAGCFLGCQIGRS